MRIKCDDNTKTGDIRTKRKFLLFPKWGNKQWRWLEFAEWEEFAYPDYPESVYRWEFLRWTDEELTEKQREDVERWKTYYD